MHVLESLLLRPELDPMMQIIYMVNEKTREEVVVILRRSASKEVLIPGLLKLLPGFEVKYDAAT